MTAVSDVLERLSMNPESVLAMPSLEIVRALESDPRLKDIRIGALKDLRKFERAAHVLYLIKESEKDMHGEPTGYSVCMIITSTGSIVLEMNLKLYEFWNYWERRVETGFSQIDQVVGEISHFFEHQKPESTESYQFRDGGTNSNLHRTMRSLEKTHDLEAIFGYKILASEC